MDSSASPRGIISANARRLALAASLAAAALAATFGGCRRGPASGGTPPQLEPSAASAASEATARHDRPPTSADERPVVLFVGTSLTAGYGLDPDEAFPALIQKKIDSAGLRYRVVNAGVSGETSAGARRRIDWVLRQRVSVLVLETGANDGLRGQDPLATRQNIQAILDAARRLRPPPKLVLLGMEALPNYGEDYRRRFRAIYPGLARENGATLVPFPLEGVAGDPRLKQADGLHPNAEGETRLAENVWRALRPLLS